MRHPHPDIPQVTDVRDRLAEARAQSQLTQLQASQKLGLNSRMVGDIEIGRHIMNLETIFKLCEVYNVDPKYILIGEN